MEVVDGDEREPARPRDRLRGREADEQRPDQPRPLRDRDAVDVVERDARLPERLAQHRHDQLEVTARGDLRDDAAEARVELGLRGDDAGADGPVLLDEGRGRLVAGGLDPEDHEAPAAGSAASSTGSFHMIIASSRLSV